MSKLSNALNKMSAFVLTLSILFCFPLCSGTSNCSALERASSKSIKSEKELEKYSDMSVFKKLFKINESSDGKWRYVFNDDGKDTITLVQAKSETPCELNSTIDGYKITRVSDMFSHIKTIKDYHWGAKIDAFATTLVLLIAFAPLVGMTVEMHKAAETTYKDIYSNITSINLEHCTVIGEGSFANCKNLKKVNLPNCKSIGKCCFKNCENLSDVIMPKVEKIPQEAFADCKNLKNIIIPNCKVKEKDCFKGCESLDKANTPKAKVA